MLFVLGATGGLGSALMQVLEQNGESKTVYGGVIGVTRHQVDFADLASVERFWDEQNRKLPPGEPIYMVNAAGRSLNGLSHKLSLEDWNRTIADNLTSNFLQTRTLAPIFKSRPGSSILVLSSIVATIGVPGTIAYAASKGGLNGLVRTASKELSRSGATINCLELGYFDHGMITQVPEDMVKKLVSEIPLGRLGNTDDFAKACQFALTCRYLTGAIIKLNGGLI